MSLTRAPAARQVGDCHHSSSPFDAAFHAAKRADLTLADRAVHAALVSLHRLGRLGEVTQEQIAEWALVCRRTVVRSVRALTAAGLLLVRRLGQGRPNAYELIGIDADALAGRSDKRARPAVPGWRPTGRDTSLREEAYRRNRKNPTARTVEDYFSGPYGRLLRRT